MNFTIMNPMPKHFPEIQDLCKRVYPFSKPWSMEQLESHRSYFPDGQLIVLDKDTDKVVGLAFSLIISWDDYSHQDNWQDYTAGGFFHNHNPRKGKTLYGAEVMVDPEYRGLGIGKMLYVGRREIVEKYELKRIRAGARLRGYSKFSDKMPAEEYTRAVIAKKIFDPTLSFQLNQGFQVIDVAANYLFNDPESLGYAAVIEWLNPKAATAKDFEKQQQSMGQFQSGHKFIPLFLPKELRRLVRRATQTLGLIIKESEGDAFYRKIETYREQLKRTRKVKSKELLEQLYAQLGTESKTDRLKIAHAFALQLETVNVCEAAYRTWRLRQKAYPFGSKTKLNLTYVLTAHPTEARSPVTVENLAQLEKILTEGIHNNFSFNEEGLSSQLRMLWHYPLSKQKSPSVMDEADYIYSIIFAPDIMDFLLSEKPGYELKIRTWVGGDKDGHPGVNQEVMLQCLNGSRGRILDVMSTKIAALLRDLENFESTPTKIRKSDLDQLKSLRLQLEKFRNIAPGDGTRIKTWSLKFLSVSKVANPILQKHHQMLLLTRMLQLFPALVMPIELREDAGQIADALSNKKSAIRGMLTELNRVSGALDITSYARGMVISHCESYVDINNACQLVESVGKSQRLPVIPLFESKEALVSARKILKDWLKQRNHIDRVRRHWLGRLELMLGYSDSAKQIGVLPSRQLIAKAMNEIETTLKSHQVKAVFFHGSGGSVARGGGSLKEQISWWSPCAIENPKLTIQGEMIQRLFATKEIINSQCIHLTNEALRRKVRKVKPDKSPELDAFIKVVEQEYSNLVSDASLLTHLLQHTPYRYLDILKLGSRPSRRPSEKVTTDSLRAIPWILCWTQSRILLPTWWGIGTAWASRSQSEKEKLIALYGESAFFSSFVKALGFTLAKVELEIWEMYYHNRKETELFARFRKELQLATDFVLDISQQKQLIWYRPWLEESMKLRSPHIHILNLLQIHAMQSSDEALLKETIVGISCGMLTTG